MGRPKRADEAGGIYHALNQGNTRSTIFHKPEDYDAFEQILAEGLERYELAKGDGGRFENRPPSPFVRWERINALPTGQR